MTKRKARKEAAVSPTIQQVIDTILYEVTSPLQIQPLTETVDTFKCGDPNREVTGIVTTFMATRRVIEKAIEQGANLIITHEPTYYNHLDQTTHLLEDPVYIAKRDLLENHAITVWRFHDHWHMHRPDGILTGFIQALGWEPFLIPDQEVVFDIPVTTLGALAGFLKSSLDLPTVRIVGKPEAPCHLVGAVLGACPGEWQLELMQKNGVEVVVCGETVEWQVCEYVRDASDMGFNRGLIILGHEKSEEPGMKYLVSWLAPKYPGVTINHIPAGDPLLFL